jgi:hypothetical protein
MAMPQGTIDLVTPKQLKRTFKANLRELGVTLDELRAQAESGRFKSERHRALWLAMRHFGQEG